MLLIGLALIGCGKYGPPVRVHRAPAATPAAAQTEEAPTGTGTDTDEDSESEERQP